MPDLSIPADLAAMMRASVIAANLEQAKAQGVGGSSWTRTRTETSGGGVTGPTVATTGGTVTAWIMREAPDRLAAALAGERFPVGVWRLYAAAGQDIQAGDTLTSASDTTLAFRVQDLDADAGYLVGTVTPTKPILTAGTQAGARAALWLLGLGAP